MNTARQTTIDAGSKLVSTDRQAETAESRKKITIANLIRWSGFAVLVAGIIFAGIQPIHPPDVLSSVTTQAWALITPLKTAMCLLFLIGITGLYARQAEKAGWLGLIGYLLLFFCWTLQTAFIFSEAFILPVLATAAPRFVESYLGIVNGNPGAMNLGALPYIYNLGVGIPYMLGGLMLGIATLRARLLPRVPAFLLAVVAVVTPAAALLPHALQRLAGMPMGLALAWLGFALFSERRENPSEPLR